MGQPSFTVFEGHRRLASGDAVAAAAAATAAQARDATRILIFDDLTGRQVEVDPRTARLALPDPPAEAAVETQARPARGRPRLGVVPREVTLLPRHWEWLAQQPGGASAALRRLVDQARRERSGADRARAAQLTLYSAMSALAGDLPRFEDASRALFAGDDAGLEAIARTWPADVAAYVLRLAAHERAARAAEPPSGAG